MTKEDGIKEDEGTESETDGGTDRQEVPVATGRGEATTSKLTSRSRSRDNSEDSWSDGLPRWVYKVGSSSGRGRGGTYRSRRWSDGCHGGRVQ